MARQLVVGKAGGSYEDGTFFVVNADGTGEQAIEGADRTCCGRVSHDGSMLLFAGFTDDGRITVAIEPWRAGRHGASPCRRALSTLVRERGTGITCMTVRCVAAFQVARTLGFAALLDVARFENPADLMGGRRGLINGHAPSSRLEDLVAGVRSATSTPNGD